MGERTCARGANETDYKYIEGEVAIFPVCRHGSRAQSGGGTKNRGRQPPPAQAVSGSLCGLFRGPLGLLRFCNPSDLDSERFRPPFQVFPPHLAMMHEVHLHPQRIRVVIVDQHKRIIQLQCVKSGENEAVPLWWRKWP